MADSLDICCFPKFFDDGKVKLTFKSESYELIFDNNRAYNEFLSVLASHVKRTPGSSLKVAVGDVFYYY